MPDQSAPSPLILKASESVSFTANDMDELNEMIAVWKKELFPFLFDDVDPTPPKSGKTYREDPTPSGPPKAEPKMDVSKLTEDQLADLYKERTGKRFMYVPLTKHQGKDRRTALIEALQ